MNPHVPVTPKRASWLIFSEKLFRPFDAFFNFVYSKKYNPLYQSGVLALVLLMVVIVTGVYLLFFYSVTAPYESMQAVQDSPWSGRWVRSLHRYASDLALVAIFWHMIRMLFQGRTWGPRALAWISGVFLTGMLLFCGWTGLVLVWDVQGQLIAMKGAEIIDIFPFFAEPIGRAFVKPGDLPRSFFFLNLFLHSAIPIGMAFVFWLHVSRVARTQYMPPKALLWGTIIALIILSILIPAPLSQKADALALPSTFPVNWFYGFWLPLAKEWSGLQMLLFWIGLFVFFSSIPFWVRPKNEKLLTYSFVREKSCTGCTTCYYDCPFEAIQMVPRTIGHGSEFVAKVNPDFCVSCGICAGSCDPMGVGPATRTGRDQLKNIENFTATLQTGTQVVLVSCSHSATPFPSNEVAVYPITCVGSLHTIIIEELIESGLSGVYIASCPSRDCWNREGYHHLHQRIYEGRESALKESIDRNRIVLKEYSSEEKSSLTRDVKKFCEDMKIYNQSHPISQRSKSSEKICEPKDFEEFRS